MSDSFSETVKRLLPRDLTLDDVTFLPTKSGKEMAVVSRKGENGIVQGLTLLGCPTCIDPEEMIHVKGGIIIRGKRALPASAISEDDSHNPAMDALFICPDCGRPILHKDYVGMMGLEELPVDKQEDLKEFGPIIL